MPSKPDSQQRGLAGEYYVAFMLSSMGYDVGITIGRAKLFDMMAVSASGKAINIQVKCNLGYYDWLVTHPFDPSPNSVVALVRLDKHGAARPELYFLRGAAANALIKKPFVTHAPRINRAKVQAACMDHDCSLVHRLLTGP